MVQKFKIISGWLDNLASEEVESLLKSNRISWKFRKIIKRDLTYKRVLDIVPTIAATGIAYAVMGLINNEVMAALNNPPPE